MLNHTCRTRAGPLSAYALAFPVAHRHLRPNDQDALCHVHLWSHLRVFPQGAGDSCGQREEQAEAHTIEPPVHLQRGIRPLCTVLQAAQERVQSDAHHSTSTTDERSTPWAGCRSCGRSRRKTRLTATPMPGRVGPRCRWMAAQTGANSVLTTLHAAHFSRYAAATDS